MPEADRAYGAPRVTAKLNDSAAPGVRVNHNRVARVMAARGVAGIRLRRRADHRARSFGYESPDLLKRDFTTSPINESPFAEQPPMTMCVWRETRSTCRTRLPGAESDRRLEVISPSRQVSIGSATLCC